MGFLAIAASGPRVDGGDATGGPHAPDRVGRPWTTGATRMMWCRSGWLRRQSVYRIADNRGVLDIAVIITNVGQATPSI
jgi:hypothetical protein